MADYKLVPSEIIDRLPEINASNYGHDDVCDLNAWSVEIVLAAVDAPDVQGEPVAWQLHLPDGRVTLEKAYPSWAEGGDGYRISPLYAAPKPAEQRPECGCCGRTDKCDDDCDAVVIGSGHPAEQHPAQGVAELVGALELARNTMAENGLNLPITFGLIDEALAPHRKGGSQ